MQDYTIIESALTNFLNSLSELQKLKILTNKKDFTCQIGEWLVSTLYDGVRSSNGIQKDWDIELNGKYIQVKTHSKASTTSARWSAVRNDINAKIDELIIVVFHENYKLKAFYKIPWSIALKRNKRSGDKDVINWSDIEDYKVNLLDLPKQSLVKLFL